jgi:hypothetical protein
VIIINLHEIGIMCIVFFVGKFVIDFCNAYIQTGEDQKRRAMEQEAERRKPPPLPFEAWDDEVKALILELHPDMKKRGA